MPSTTIQLRRGTNSQWTTANTVLVAGEPGYDTTLKKLRIGDGTTPWDALPGLNDDALSIATADVPISENISVQEVLSARMVANVPYRFEVLAYVTAANDTPGIKWVIDCPSLTSRSGWADKKLGTSDTSVLTPTYTTGNSFINLNSSSPTSETSATGLLVYRKGVLVSSANSTIRFRLAQVTSSETPVILKSGSHLSIKAV
jgi:hypothetical protein